VGEIILSEWAAKIGRKSLFTPGAHLSEVSRVHDGFIISTKCTDLVYICPLVCVRYTFSHIIAKCLGGIIKPIKHLYFPFYFHLQCRSFTPYVEGGGGRENSVALYIHRKCKGICLNFLQCINRSIKTACK
jgi:hypothetical protein